MLALNTTELMTGINAWNEAANVLKEVEDQLRLIVEAAQAAKEAICQIGASDCPAGVSETAREANGLASVGALVWLNWDAIVATGNTVLDWFQQKMLPFFTVLPEQLGGVFQDVAATVAGAVNEVITTVEAMANSVIGAINAIIEAWNSFELKMGGQTFLAGTPFEKKIPSVTIGTPDSPLIPTISIPRVAIPAARDTTGAADIGIPAFAAGGIVRRPTFALLGESGPEAVIPLNGGRRVGIAPTINVTVVNRGTIVHDRQFVDLVARAWHVAQRQGRVR